MSLSASVSSFHFLPYIPMSVSRSYPQQVGVARFTSTYLFHVALSLRFFLPLSTLYTNVCNPVISPTSGGGQIHLNLAAVWLTPTLLFDPFPSQPSCFLPQPTSSMSLSASVSSFHFLSYIPMPATRSYPQQVGVAIFTSTYLFHVALSRRFFLPLSTLYTNELLKTWSINMPSSTSYVKAVKTTEYDWQVQQANDQTVWGVTRM